jgi:hypothetical protein
MEEEEEEATGTPPDPRPPDPRTQEVGVTLDRYGRIVATEPGEGVATLKLTPDEEEAVQTSAAQASLLREARQMTTGSTLGDNLAAGAYGFGSQLTVGGLDYVAREYMGEEQYNLLQTRLGMTAADEVGGTLGFLTSLAIGPEAWIARGARAAQTALVRQGVSRGAAGIAAMTLDGALSGTAEGIRQSLIRDGALNAERIVHTAGMGTLFGMGLGVAANRVGRLIQRAGDTSSVPEVPLDLPTSRGLPLRRTAAEVDDEWARYISRRNAGEQVEPFRIQDRALNIDDALGEPSAYVQVSAAASNTTEYVVNRVANSADWAYLASGPGRRMTQFGQRWYGGETGMQQAVTYASENMNRAMAIAFEASVAATNEASLRLGNVSGAVSNIANTLRAQGRGNAYLDAFIDAISPRGGVNTVSNAASRNPVNNLDDLYRAIVRHSDDVAKSTGGVPTAEAREARRLIEETAEREISKLARETLGESEATALLGQLASARRLRRNFTNLRRRGIAQVDENTGSFSMRAESLIQPLRRADTGRELTEMFTTMLRDTDDLLAIGARRGTLEMAGELERRQLFDTAEAWSEAFTRARAVDDFYMGRGQENFGSGLWANVGFSAPAIGGAVAGSLIGGPMGGALGLAIGFAASGVMRPVSSWLRIHSISDIATRSSMTRAGLIERVRGNLIGGMSLPRSSTLTGLVPRTAVRLLSASTREEQFGEIRDRVNEFTEDPQVLQEHIAQVTEGIRSDMGDDMANFMGMTMLRGLSHLKEALPYQETDLFGETTPPSQVQMQDFIDRYMMFEAPMMALDLLADNALTQAHVEALEAIWPATLQQMRLDIVEMLQENKEPVPYQHKLALGSFLNMPVDSTMKPQFVHKMQQRYAQTTQQDKVQFGQGPRNVIPNDLSTNTMTGSQGVTSRLGS